MKCKSMLFLPGYLKAQFKGLLQGTITSSGRTIRSLHVSGSILRVLFVVPSEDRFGSIECF